MGPGAVRAGHCEWIRKFYVGRDFCLSERVILGFCGQSLSICSKYPRTHVGRAPA